MILGVSPLLNLENHLGTEFYHSLRPEEHTTDVDYADINEIITIKYILVLHTIKKTQ